MYVRMYIRTCICTYIHAYVHTYMCTYLHNHTYGTAQMQLHSQAQVSSKVRYRSKATSHLWINDRTIIITRKSMLTMLLSRVIDCRFMYILLDACSYVRI